MRHEYQKPVVHTIFLNIIDREATCWKGQPPPGQTGEIIEIGVCELNIETLERTRQQIILVRPERSEVSDFCSQLTGLEHLSELQRQRKRLLTLPFSQMLRSIRSLSWAEQTPLTTLARPFGQK